MSCRMYRQYHNEVVLGYSDFFFYTYLARLTGGGNLKQKQKIRFFCLNLVLLKNHFLDGAKKFPLAKPHQPN